MPKCPFLHISPLHFNYQKMPSKNGGWRNCGGIIVWAKWVSVGIGRGDQKQVRLLMFGHLHCDKFRNSVEQTFDWSSSWLSWGHDLETSGTCTKGIGNDNDFNVIFLFISIFLYLSAQSWQVSFVPAKTQKFSRTEWVWPWFKELISSDKHEFNKC
jgi:hypothetical protein